MSSNSWNQTLLASFVDGPALTAASAASLLISGSPAVNQNRFTFPAALLKIGDMFRITASGRISCVVTTPGTARYDLRFGSTVVFDTLAMNLNTTAQTNVPWWLDLILTCRSIGAGTNATLFGMGIFTSPAVVGSPATSAGGSGTIVLPNTTAPGVGSGFDSTVSNTIDMFFTQTVATGSMTCHLWNLVYLT